MITSTFAHYQSLSVTSLGEEVVEEEVGEDDAGELAREEARVFEQEHAQLEAQKQAMLQDQVLVSYLSVMGIDHGLVYKTHKRTQV